jgi:hypothetical protein
VRIKQAIKNPIIASNDQPLQHGGEIHHQFHKPSANRDNPTQSIDSNWWDFEIGSPYRLMDIVFLLHDQLTAAQLANDANAVGMKSMLKEWGPRDTARDFVAQRPLATLALARDLVADPGVVRRGELIGHNSFPAMDRVVHLGKGFGFGLSMCSTRMQFKGVGVTLTEKKSWFMFDDEVVCLGAGITSTDNRPIETTVENRKLDRTGSNAFTVNRVSQSKVPGWTETMAGVTWAHLAGTASAAGIGYYFPQAATIATAHLAGQSATNHVAVSVISALDSWRLTQFGTTGNTGQADEK